MGSKGNTVKTKSTYTPDPGIYGAGQQALSMGQSAANLPFNIPQQPIAGFTPDQLQAFQQIRDTQGMTNPFFSAAANYMNASAQPISGADVAQYYNPMASNVFGQMSNIFGQQRAATTGALTQQAGGVGADRIAVGQAELANQQGLAAGQTAAGLYQQALNSAQQNKQMQAGAGYGLGQLGPAAQAAALQATGVLGQAGGVQQQLQQAFLNAPYAQQLQQAQYPYQQAQFLAGITGSLAPSQGGTTQGQTTYPTPSPLSQALGVGTALMGMGNMGLFTGLGGKGGGMGSAVPTTYAPYGGTSASGSYFSPTMGYGGVYKRGGAVIDHDIYDTPANTNEDWKEGEYASGGMVNPYDTLKGFAYGGDIGLTGQNQFSPFAIPKNEEPIYSEGDYSPLDAAATANDNRPLYSESDYSPLDATADANDSRPLYAEGDFSPIDANASPADYPTREQFMSGLRRMYGPMMSDTAQAAPAVNMPALAGPNQLSPYRPGPSNFPTRPVLTAPPVTPTAPRAPVAPRGPSVPSYNPATMQARQNPYTIPDEARPYPGARQMDWGQRAARSPWMSLVKAGAEMANSIGPIGSVIGKGLLAGAGELESQRKSLQTEEGINQRAQSLYQQAKHYLDQYSKMTPYQRGSLAIQSERLAREKFTPVNYETSDGKVIAASYDPKTGQYRTEGGEPLTGGKIIARQSGAESATSRGNAAYRQAKDDPNYVTDQIGTINKWRAKNGLPPLEEQEAGGLTKEMATPDPGPDKRIIGRFYIVNGQPRQWRGTGGE